MGYIQFLKLLFQNLYVTPVCESPIGQRNVTNDHTTFRPDQDMSGCSKHVIVHKNRNSSSNSKRSLSAISKQRRHNNRRPAPPKRKTKSIIDTSAEELDVSVTEEQQQHQSIEPVVYSTRGRKDRNHNYKRYLARVLRDVNATKNRSYMTISNNAMECMSNFMVDIFAKIAHEASQQVQKNKTKTLGDWDIRAAVKIVIPGELGRHANEMGHRKLKNINGGKMVNFNPEIEYAPMQMPMQ